MVLELELELELVVLLEPKFLQHTGIGTSARED